MYKQGTVLKRKDTEAFDTDDQHAIYNDVEVIGISQVQSGATAQDWDGVDAQAVSIKPLEFGTVIDLPQGELEKKYDVVSIPEPKEPEIPVRTVVDPNAGALTPEQQFAKKYLGE